jgi:hemolysin III
MSDKIGRFTYREELANFISHFAGAILAGAGLTLMVVASAMKGSAWHVVSTAIFGTTMVMLYFASAVAHGLPPGKAKQFFFVIDQAAIYLLIAGTYTPLALVALHGPWGWTLFGLQWAFAIAGITRKMINPGKVEAGVKLFDIIIYVVMGCMLVIAIVPITKALPFMGFMWIMIGGACYLLGITFYRRPKFKYAHLIWHLMVLAGSICHFFAIFFYVIPMEV